MITNPILSTSTTLLAIWAILLATVVLFAWIMAAFPRTFTKVRPVLFTLVALPAMTVLILFVIRGFTSIERPLVHWVFSRESEFALRFGMILDPIAWISSIVFAAALCGTTLQNRPNVRLVAAALGAWAGFSTVASSKTIWTALLGVAIQSLFAILPLLPASEGGTDTEDRALADDRWMSTTKRNWIAIACSLAGATALVSLGIHLDFNLDPAWAKLDEETPGVVAACLFLLGLVLLLTPAFSARSLQSDASTQNLSSNEERLFVFEGSIAWSGVIILYRLHECLQGTPWLLAISAASGFVALLSLVSLVFHERRRNAASQWMMTLPALVGAILPMLPTQEAFVFVAGILPIAAGLMLVFESPKTKAGVWLSGFFVLGVSGLVGWSSSAGLSRFFSDFEKTPALQGAIATLWLLFAAVGWRIAIRGKADEKQTAPLSFWAILGFLVLLGFGPTISGRWGGGGIPEGLDWINGAKTWPWLERFADSNTETTWVGFAVSQTIWVLGILIGTFVSSSSALFPFAEKNGRGREITSGLFGAYWLSERAAEGLKFLGVLWSEKVSAPLWEKVFPMAVTGVVRTFARTGEFAEKVCDPITSSVYGNLFRAPAKFVSWMHGGNARLYGWFALIWILIFSLYLTRH